MGCTVSVPVWEDPWPSCFVSAFEFELDFLDVIREMVVGVLWLMLCWINYTLKFDRRSKSFARQGGGCNYAYIIIYEEYHMIARCG